WTEIISQTAILSKKKNFKNLIRYHNSYFGKTRECLHKALALNPDKESKKNIKRTPWPA
ncbi:hypothetical protein C5S32_01070, partial [ANME-1 cluster archaeon GoMg1]|nr:hypothetical protein [ANME-1 cluster archaeon GoMg1]